jgi:two-component system chemotaxis sensor kinase CheA
MNLDMSRFHDVFFEEVAEHLESLERILLELDVASASRDDLDAIFRAAHSIKGGSGTFGFAEMASFTHVLESLLDKVRNAEIVLTDGLVDLTLRAGDVLRGQLRHYRENAPLDPALAAALVTELHAALERGGVEASGVPLPAPAAAAPPVRMSIVFTCRQAEAPRAALPEGIRSALAAIGTLDAVDDDLESVAWSYELSTTQNEAAVRDLFEFVQMDTDELTLVSVAAPVDLAPLGPPPANFGFFDDEPDFAPESAAFGFFSDAPGAPDLADAPAQAAGAPATAAPVVTHAPTGRSKSSDSGTIRVNLDKVDALINLVGEMVISQAMLAQAAAHQDGTSEEMRAAIDQIAQHTRELRTGVMSIRMVPMSFIFSRFPRMVRDQAAGLGKKVTLQTIGDDTELDKGLIENIVDPLTHLVRNSLDHGIEPPEDRIAAGKDPCGTITMRSSHQGGNVVIEIMDDGRGLNREKILAKALSKGLPVSADMPNEEVWSLIFMPGFSTAEKVTDLSGRGVGMDVVKRNITAMGGRVEVASTAGHGTHITIRLPLTLAILDGLSVAVGSDIFIIPLAYIVESMQPDAATVKPIPGRGHVLSFRTEFIPVIAMHELFRLERRSQTYADGIFVIVENDGYKAAVFVDSLEGQHQVVIKSIETNFRRVEGIAGATSLGDGRVSLILDVAGLLRLSGAVGAVA